MKLTAPQNAALRLIHEKPGKVAARVNGQSGHWIGFRTLHPRPEARLLELGLVETITVKSRTGEHEVPVLALTSTGYAALGVEPPAGEEQSTAEQHPEDEIPLPLPDWFRRAYQDALGDIHRDSDSAPYRRVRHHLMNNQPNAPRWLLGHIADVAALLVDLTDEDKDTAPSTRTASRRGCVELLDTLRHHGARPWPVVGHRMRPWGNEFAHCEDCTDHVGPRPPADVIDAETAVDAERATRRAAYEEQLAAELLNTEAQIADEHGKHMRPKEVILYTDPSGTQLVGVVESVYQRGDGTAAADILLVTGQTATATAAQLGPIPELPDMGELIEGRWLITDKTGTELARVTAHSREEALNTARRIPAVREAARRDGGLASRPLWTADLSASSA